MNKSIKTVLIVIGACLLAYGIYTLVVPETIMSIGSLDVKAKNNDNSFITIGLGLAVLLITYMVGRKS